MCMGPEVWWPRARRKIPDRTPNLSESLRAVEGKLTPRQRDVLALVSEGLTNTEIGEVLGMTEKTARTHRLNALRRLHARNSSHAVAILLRRGDIL